MCGAARSSTAAQRLDSRPVLRSLLNDRSLPCLCDAHGQVSPAIRACTCRACVYIALPTRTAAYGPLDSQCHGAPHAPRPCRCPP